MVPRRRIPLIAAAAACGTLVLAAAAVGAWRYVRGSADTLALPPGGAALLQAASADVQVITSYDYRRLDTDVQSAHSRMTDRMRTEYDSTLAQVRASAPRQKAILAGTVVGGGLEAVDGDRATALVFLNQRVTRAGQKPVTNASPLRVALLRQEGRWRVDRLTVGPGSAPAPGQDTSWPGSRVSALFHAAQSCTGAMNSVDYQRFDRMVATVRNCATGEFRDQWNRHEAQIRSAAEKSQIVSRVTGTDIALTTSVGPSQATVLVALSRQPQSPATQQANPQYFRYRATMTRVGDRWLLAKLETVT
jgi:hypothetical protein